MPRHPLMIVRLKRRRLNSFFNSLTTLPLSIRPSSIKDLLIIPLLIIRPIILSSILWDYARWTLWFWILSRKRYLMFKIRDFIVMSPSEPEIFAIIEDVFCKEVYGRVVSKDLKIVDIGSHIGLYTIKSSAEMGKSGLIISVEPHPVNFTLLRINLDLNNLKNVLTVNLIASDKNGREKLYLSESSALCSTLFKEGGYIEVNARRLDSILQKLGITEIDIVKIDVEGSELNVLQGIGDYLKRVKAIVVAAYHYEGEEQEISRFLLKMGFKILVADGYVYASRKNSISYD